MIEDLDCGELGDISDYDDETLDIANQAFFAIEEEEDHEKALELLHITALRRYSYSMDHYGVICLREKRDIKFAAECVLMAALRGQENALEFFGKVAQRSKIVAMLSQASVDERNEWLRTGKQTESITRSIEALAETCKTKTK